MTTDKRRHRVTIVVEGYEMDGWEDYEISSSLIEPADSFTLRRPFDNKAWLILRRDARIRVSIDGAPVIDGFIDRRSKRSADGTLEVAGRCRCGRLVQESAPTINYDGLEMTEAIRRLASPWFTKVTLSDARNRKLRLGKGRRVPSGNEPIIVRRTSAGGRVQPGQSRWAVIESIVSQAGLMCWSSGDGRELFVGRPNYSQAPQFLILKAHAGASTSQSTCIDLMYDEDNGDRYSLIAVVGTGGGTTKDYGYNVASRRASVVDGGEGETTDGTGRDFLYPKRLLMPERNFDSNHDAEEIALREQLRRDFKRTHVTAELPLHGQFIGPGAPTIFAPNTVASVVDEDFEPRLEDDFWIYSCQYRRSRATGETTVVEMVPKGTEVVL